MNIQTQPDLLDTLKARFTELKETFKSRSIAVVFICEEISFNKELKERYMHLSKKENASGKNTLELFFDWLFGAEVGLGREDFINDIFGKTSLKELYIFFFSRTEDALTIKMTKNFIKNHIVTLNDKDIKLFLLSLAFGKLKEAVPAE